MASLAEDRGQPVDRPAHYTFGTHEVIDVIEDWGLAEDHYRACALKYIARAGRKEDFVQDLKKAIWYLERRIRLEEDK